MIIKQRCDFYKIKTIEDIKNTPSNSILLFDFNKEIMKFCKENDIKYAVIVSSILEAILANNLNATFIIINKKIAKKIQEIANEYLFDSKILVKIVFEWEIETFAKLGIDGVLLKDIS